MTKPPISSRRQQLDPKKEALIEAYSATPDIAPVASALAPQTVPAKEAKSKGFNYRMTPTRHAQINAMRKGEDRSFQWMLDKLIDLGIEHWERGGTQ